MIPLLDLLDRMPHYTGKLPTSEVRGIHTGLKPNENYIPPDLIEPDSVQPGSVILLMAPGAMGKTEAAKEAAARLNSPYVNLADMRVGTGSLTGELTKALGEAFPGFVAALKAGEASLVLDSTDEAQLAVGAENYQAFLSDIVWLLLDAEPANQVLFLGRRDATESTYLVLNDFGFRAPTYELAPLSLNQAIQLIDSTLDRKTIGGNRFTTHRVHPEPFARLRSALFLDISKALKPEVIDLSSWPEVSYFLGYPPVLLALSERLAVDNPAQELADFERTDSRERGRLRGELLRGIVETILDRESGKARDKICEALAIRRDTDEAAELYTSEEQILRLIAKTGPMEIEPSMPGVLDESDHAKYEELIGGFLQDHPFLHGSGFANVVFSDYVLAWATSSPVTEVFAPSRAQFLKALPVVGPFFASFAHAMTQLGGEGNGRIREELVGAAIRSNALGSDEPLAFYIEHGGEAHLGLLDRSSRVMLNSSLDFSIEDPSGVLELTSPVSNLTCVVESAVLLRDKDGRVEFGPAVAIIASEIEFMGKSFTHVGSAGPEDGWSYMSAEAVSHVPDLKVVSHDTTQLGISWPDIGFQWRNHAVEDIATQSVSAAVRSQVLLALRRLLTAFGSSVKADPSVSADKVDRVLVGANGVFKATLGALMELEVIDRSGSLYRLNLSALGKFGVSYPSIRGDDPSVLLKALFQAVVSTTTFEEFQSST